MAIVTGEQFWQQWHQQCIGITDAYQQGKQWYNLWTSCLVVDELEQPLDQEIIDYWRQHRESFPEVIHDAMLSVILGDVTNSPVILPETTFIENIVPWIEEQMPSWFLQASGAFNPYYFVHQVYHNASPLAHHVMLAFLYDARPEFFEEHPLDDYDDTVLHQYYQIYMQGETALVDDEWDVERTSKCRQFYQIAQSSGGSFIDTLRLMAPSHSYHQETELFLNGLEPC